MGIEFGNLGIANLGITGGKYLIKMIFDISFEIGTFEMSHVPNFNNFCGFLILGPIWTKQVVDI